MNTTEVYRDNRCPRRVSNQELLEHKSGVLLLELIALYMKCYWLSHLALYTKCYCFSHLAVYIKCYYLSQLEVYIFLLFNPSCSVQ
jgi:hypothetical protein